MSGCGARHPVPVVCWETGERFGTMAEAAKSCGCGPENLRRATITHGMAGGYHWYRESDGKPDADELKCGHGSKRPIRETSTGRLFPTCADAAFAFGLTASQVSYRVQTGTKTPDGLGFERAGSAVGKAVVCWETGRWHATASEAAREIGCSTREVSRACKEGTLLHGSHWYYEKAGRPRGCDLSWGSGSPVVDVVTGTVYASVSAAARAAGVTPQAVSWHIEHGGHPRGGDRWQWATCSDMEGKVVL